MNKTPNKNVSIENICVDTQGLMKITNCGRQTAVEIGTAAKAKITIGRRVLWNVGKIQKYLDSISE